MSPTREQVVEYLHKQGYPRAEEEGLVDEFMNGNAAQAGEVRGVDWQGMYDEAVEKNYDFCDVDRWFNVVKAMRLPLKFETAMAITNALYEHEDVDALELPAGEQVLCEMAIDRWMARQGIELSDMEYHRLKAETWRDAGMVFDGAGFDMILHEIMNAMQMKAEGVHFGIGANLVHSVASLAPVQASCFDVDMVRGKKRAMDMLALGAKANGWEEHGFGCKVEPYEVSMFVCSYENDECLDYIERDEASVEFRNGKLVLEESLAAALDEAKQRSGQTIGGEVEPIGRCME